MNFYLFSYLRQFSEIGLISRLCGQISFVCIESYFFCRSHFGKFLAQSVQRIEFDMDMIHSHSFHDHCHPMYFQSFFEEFRDFFRRSHEGEIFVCRHIESIRIEMFFWYQERLSFAIRKDIHQCYMVFIFPDLCGRKLSSDDLAENTIGHG